MTSSGPVHAPSLSSRVPGPLRVALRGLLAVLGVLLAGVLCLVFVVGVARAVAYPNLPEITSMTDYRPKVPLRV